MAYPTGEGGGGWKPTHPEILLPSAVHLEEWLTVSQQSVSPASIQSDSQWGKQAGRQGHTVWVFSVADSATSSGESSDCQNKE